LEISLDLGIIVCDFAIKDLLFASKFYRNVHLSLAKICVIVQNLNLDLS